MQSAEVSIVKLNKFKVSVFMIIFVTLALVGGWFLYPNHTNQLIDRHSFNPVTIYTFAFLSLTIGGFLSLKYVNKLFDEKAGVRITVDGLYNNSHTAKSQFILWSDIVEIRQGAGMGLSVHVKDPDKYLNTDNWFTSYTGHTSMRVWGTPVVVSSSLLTIGKNELLNLLLQHLQECQQKNQ